jgi:hydroxymethylpyrimidine pyrophosphatase-like HAD family hydrolase
MNDIRRIRLLFLDLDSTLVGREDLVSPRTITALHRAQKSGCAIVICTARNRYMVEHVAAQWHGHGYAILSNGAIIAEWESGRVLQKIALPFSVVERATEIAQEFATSPLLFGVHAEKDGGQKVYTDDRFPQPVAYMARNAHRLVPLSDLSEREGDSSLAPVGMGVYAPQRQAESLTGAWQEALGTDVSAFASPDHKYDCWCAYLNNRQANKALAAARIAEMLNVSREETMAVGDHLNDLEMLRWAGLGVCMGDGHEEARTCATHVTGTLADDGVAQAVERFILGNRE